MLAWMLVVGRLVVAPDVGLVVQAAAGRELPLGLGRQALAGPLGIGDRIEPGDVNDGMIVLALDAAARPFGMPPVGAGRPLPPLAMNVGAKIDRPARSA